MWWAMVAKVQKGGQEEKMSASGLEWEVRHSESGVVGAGGLEKEGQV